MARSPWCFHSRAMRCLFFFNDTATTEIYTLSLHDALPISTATPPRPRPPRRPPPVRPVSPRPRSEEHTSELQSRLHLVCRLLLEKKKNEGDLLYHVAEIVVVGLVDTEPLVRCRRLGVDDDR